MKIAFFLQKETKVLDKVKTLLYCIELKKQFERNLSCSSAININM